MHHYPFHFSEAFIRHLMTQGRKPAWAKTDYFERVFPHPLNSVEWEVVWPIEHRNGKTYNPDYWCGSLNTFIEVATSFGNISSEREKWQKAMDEGYRLRVFWWEGFEITECLPNASAIIRKGGAD